MNRTKRKIFETSMNLFATKGYDATSIEEITSVVGVAKGTLYYHFSSKEEIFTFLVEEGMKLLQTLIQRFGEILLLQDPLQVGLLIEQVDNSLLEAVALLCADVAGVPAVGAGIVRFQVIFREPCVKKKLPLAGEKPGQRLFSRSKGGFVPVQKVLCLGHADRRDLFLRLLKGRDTLVGFLTPPAEPLLVFQLPLFIDTHK